MFGKKQDSARIDAAVNKAVNYELTVADMARRSQQRAWWVAGASVTMSLILLGGYFYMLPLKEKVPYLIMADAYTGQATFARLRGEFPDERITRNEAINRANVASFLRARESYDWTLIGDRDWKTVFTMADPAVSSAYRVLYSERNESGPLKVYGKAQAIRIKILSIQLMGGDPHSGPSGAVVRFQRSLFDKSTGTTRFLDNKIATLEYQYKSNLAMADADREFNPLGFQVTAYRVDTDYATTPAVSEDAATAAPLVNGETSVAPVAPGEPVQPSTPDQAATAEATR